MVFYGTYLTFAVREIFLKENDPFTAKELAIYIEANADVGLTRRVRRALKELEDIGFLESQWHCVPGHPHLTTKKYSKRNEQGQELS